MPPPPSRRRSESPNVELTTLFADALDGADADLVEVYVATASRQHCRKVNTENTYAWRREEFIAYCAAKYAYERVPELVTAAKLFAFLFYQAFRSKRKRGTKKQKLESENNNDNNDDSGPFNEEEYDEIHSSYKAFMRVPTNKGSMPPDPVNPLSPQSIISYRSAIHDLFVSQRQQVQWSSINSSSVTALTNLIKSRRLRVAEAANEERLREDILPLANMGKEKDIESYFWESGKSDNRKSTLPSLRNRYILLQTFSSLLRAESMFLARLSDCFSLRVPKDSRDVDEMMLACFQIATGT